MPYGKGVPIPKGWLFSSNHGSKADADAKAKALRKQGYIVKVNHGMAYNWAGQGRVEYVVLRREHKRKGY